MKRILLYVVCGLTMATTFNSCYIYNKYHRPDDITVEGLFRDTVSDTDTLAADSVSFGDLPWEEVFTDPTLQELIRTGLERNSDLQSAMLQIEAAQASFTAARLAFLPSLSLTPQGGVSSFDSSKGQWTYNAPVTASWEIDIFGRLLNSERNAKAMLMQSEAYKQAVRTQLIATIANGYYTLLMLDEQLAITEETAMTWQKSVETIKAMKIGGMTNEAAVAQSEANSYMIAASIPSLRQQIRETENSLSTLLYQAPQTIKRGKFQDQQLPEMYQVGVPVQLLANRPDVRSAELSLAAAYYSTNIARSAFYPNIVISGSAGWTNSAGSAIVNPGKLLLSAAASLVQPLFNRGSNIANLKAAKAQQKIAAINFQQAILNAGAEVSNALYQIQSTKETLVNRDLQVASLEKAVESTMSLMTLGTSTYLEVLTAQQSLLNAQLSQISDSYQCMVAVINLYQALGGGREIEEENK
ncbi:efflux transporter outer membrane subunit [Barnesiella viscericola]|uniref:efflux transporter outer membrane subunit n=1 Tax=Barnesiella viscericola TaxID=397865 RepID=UPI002354792D|nr:efflux transporter outer membrane subunit [Barnesiella viscericola]